MTSRDAITSVARRSFLARGYTRTTIRRVASEAGVDPALVIRRFGSKEQLLVATLDLDRGFDDITNAPLDALGAHIARTILLSTSDQRSTYRAFVHASDHEQIRNTIGDTLVRTVINPLSARLQGQHPDLRARLVAAQVLGLLNTTALPDDPVLGITDAEPRAKLYGHAIQSLIDQRG